MMSVKQALPLLQAILEEMGALAAENETSEEGHADADALIVQTLGVMAMYSPSTQLGEVCRDIFERYQEVGKWYA